MLNPLTRIRPDERRATFAATMTVFLVLVAHALLETARDALFLANAPTTRLPIVYLSLAICGIALAQLSSRGAARFDARRSLLVSQTLAAVGTLAIWVSTRAETSAVYYALYIWAGIASMSVLVPLWLHLSERFTPTQAKRLFPIIGAGSIAGVLVGYALSAEIARRFGTKALLPASALVYLTGALGPLVLGRRTRREEALLDAESGEHSEHAEQQEAADEERPHAGAMGLWDAAAAALLHPYVRRVTLLLLLGSVTVTLVDYVFKTVVAQYVPPAQLGMFFARTYFFFNVLSLATLVGAVGILLNRFGVIVMMALLPVFLLVGGLGVALVGGFAAAMALKATDGAMHWSTHKTATELLYTPMPGEIRSAVKSVVDMATQRMGQAIGSLIILAVLAITNEVRVFGPLIALAAALWAFVTLRSREPYLDLFRDTLNEGAIETRVEFPDLDVGSLEALIVALNAPDDKKVIAAMDLLEQKRKAHLIPALVLYHPSPEVVVRALDLFAAARRSDFLPIVDRLLTHEYAEVRAAALRAMTAVRPDPHALERALEHHCPVVNVTALVGLAAGGWRPVDETVHDLLRHVDEDSELSRPMIARAIRYRPLPAFAPVLTRLAEAPEVETRREAVLAMRAARDVGFLPTLLGLLRERALREDVRDALIELGTPALDALESALGDASIPFSVRVHLPRTISRFQSQRAAEMLVRLLLAEPRGMVRFKALRGLGRLVANDPDMVLEAETLDEVLRRTMASCCRVLHWRLMLQNGAAEQAELRSSSQELLVQLLLDKEQLAIERLFRTLGLRFRDEDIARIYDGLRSHSPLIRSSSRELLASALPASLGRAVLGLVDDDAPEVRLEAIREYYEVGDLDYPRLLAVLAADASPTLRSIASYHAAEIGVTTPEAEPAEELDLPEAFARMRARVRELLRDREAIGGRHGA